MSLSSLFDSKCMLFLCQHSHIDHLFRLLYLQAEYGAKAFRVVSDTYVTDDAGTGVVHQVCTIVFCSPPFLL